MNRQGFTVAEMLIVVILIGVLTILAFPRLQTAFVGSNRRAARASIMTMVAKARASAVARGCRSAIHFASAGNGSAWVTVCQVSGGAIDTLGGVDQIGNRFNVSIAATRDSVSYVPNGLSFDNVRTIVRVTAGTEQDSVVINEIGKVIQ